MKQIPIDERGRGLGDISEGDCLLFPQREPEQVWRIDKPERVLWTCGGDGEGDVRWNRYCLKDVVIKQGKFKKVNAKLYPYSPRAVYNEPPISLVELSGGRRK